VRYALSPYLKQIRFVFKGLIRADRINIRDCQILPFCAKKNYLQENRLKDYYNVGTVWYIMLRTQQSNFRDFGSRIIETSDFPRKVQIHIYMNIIYTNIYI
jgi:hypothetical protein